jgi:VIT1/CCC1 family predicted Fe2+/Mn2+ transporter
LGAKTAAAEPHFTGSEVVRDVIIGMADGLTVPFALAAGLSGVVTSSALVLVAGLAEIVAGSIAMGLGGYLAARSESEHYQAELERERFEIQHVPDLETAEVREVLAGFGLKDELLESAVGAVTEDDQRWLDFMMRNELNLEPPDPKRARNSAATIGFSYIAGGALPLTPYALGLPVATALLWSAVITLAALLVFGGVKGRFTGVSMAKAALQTALVGGLAASAAYLLARLVKGLV